MSLCRTGLRVLLLTAVLASVGCADSTPTGSDPADPVASESAAAEHPMEVQMASYDLVAGEPSRVLAGLITEDQLFLSYGRVEMEFFYAGEDQPEGEVTVSAGPKTVADFLPIEGGPQADRPGPIATTASDGRGVYAGRVEFPEAGYWVLQVKAETTDGDSFVGKTQMRVLEEHQAAAVGDPAPASDNLTVRSTDAPPQAIDSRAESRRDVPDPELHSRTVADVLKAGRPMLVVISTPVYCVSRFCGPVTDMVSELSKKYQGTEFIHIEVWREFEEQVMNKAAAEWIYRGGEITEPWLYLVDQSGKIEQRWDNVATREEIEPYLRAIEKGKAAS